MCKRCGKTFGLLIHTRQKTILINRCVELHNLGMPFRGISRVLKVSPQTVQNWIKKKGKLVEQSLPGFCKTMEFDELFSFVNNRTNHQYVWIAVERETKNLLSVEIGRRRKVDFHRMWKKLKTVRVQNYCSDGYIVYNVTLPKTNHLKGKQHTYTVEGMMSLLRHYLARFRRKTRCYSKSVEMMKYSLLVFMDSWNAWYLGSPQRFRFERINRIAAPIFISISGVATRKSI
ncbi:IS1 family transposase [bacterium SCSIO 12741]|nr:IS1 family transposase [bacterium SCSIO 12741]